MTDYYKLSKATRLALCRRYGHKKVLDRTDNHCARCSHRWPHEGLDTLAKYFELRALHNLKDVMDVFGSKKVLPKTGGTITFNSWRSYEA